jgi:HEAT repeat protein
VRKVAAGALGQLGVQLEDAALRARVVKSLIVALMDSDSDLRAAAAGALVKIGAPAVKPLMAALKDGNWSVRRAAAGALGQLGARLEDAALRARAVEPLIAALKDSDRQRVREAADALGQLGDPRAVQPLIAALKDDELWVRRNAAESLVRLYQSGLLDEAHKALILAERGRISTKHVDGMFHSETHGSASDCTYTDSDESHTDDLGIGVPFPD